MSLLIIIATIWLWMVINESETQITNKQNKIMSQLSDLAATLTALTTKLQAIDTAVQALVAASNANPTLDTPTQAALDALVAEVGTVATDAKV